MAELAQEYLFPVAPPATVDILGLERPYPISRIFCVGRNYAEHAKEMGVEVDREAPFYFLKPASAAVVTGSTIPYPPGTANYHYEMELVIAVGKPAFKVTEEQAAAAVFAYGCGLDMTRRDLQLDARAKGRPWDLGKAFEQSAILSPMTRAESISSLEGRKIQLSVNGVVKQSALLDDLVWKVEEIIAHLSGYYHLMPGDLIFTGTPAGVGAVVAGDVIEGTIEGLEPIKLSIGPAE
ncbi:MULTISPECIES: fumarylacetoacetate hydrolase family protein [Rhizobium/Agrobacterium group]|uniref:fumarylacetoacetate hydrolase family protein n=1 Tax=Rhizobium/Agrobacterium group TaxID=227290 RepID=UPI001ADA7987|nr:MULTISPECIES: fumarylacetoacetate hydrolase family protein [Rhizobium/Agrobacterium group]MBO9112570.1 fumarylacetoacetate hydrolase family protein [Agrobacterium sp. S2/73]QXZ76074.1 fumarylacetoacetate hydrolase family protein [Agrobacterium sp. S7/73]QYA16920.1 fumarylacetoacetate hydrolase family protein [Rhizobium sp. AB2/73]UEQ85508.1 fumarylacetoacetate hydrolase family protein [Rhizobium sp. AB2/73]